MIMIIHSQSSSLAAVTPFSIIKFYLFSRSICQPSNTVHAHSIMSDAEEAPKKARASESKTYEERCESVNVISHPLASKKSTKKAHKLVKKASSVKHLLRRGVKEVVKGVFRKGEKGVAILAGDIYPIDVISHLPLLLEEKDIPYVFVPSKQDLGAAASTKRPTSCVLIRDPSTVHGAKDFEGQELYDTLIKEAKKYDPTTVSS